MDNTKIKKNGGTSNTEKPPETKPPATKQNDKSGKMNLQTYMSEAGSWMRRKNINLPAAFKRHCQITGLRAKRLTEAEWREAFEQFTGKKSDMK